jgi:tripartite-type tricarboxylate transporter receptor subunit TctC
MDRIVQNRRNFLKLIGIGGGAALLGGLPQAFAKEVYPAKSITWITPQKAGGGFDLVARTICPYLGKYLKEVSKGAKGGDVVVKNVPEAGGRRGYSNIYHAKPDGYTIGDFNTGLAAESLVSKLDIDYNKYTFLLRSGVSLRVIVAPKNGFKSWEEMMKAGAEKELKWAVASFAREIHISSILIKETAKVPARLINFPGTAETTNALLRGDVHMATLSEESAKTLIDAGEFRVLTVLSETSQYPGVPSMAQLGYPELADSCRLHRLVIGPPNLPEEIVDILSAGFKKVFSDKEFLSQGKKIDFEPEPLYGADAERQARKVFKYYDEKAPILKKYLT